MATYSGLQQNVAGVNSNIGFFFGGFSNGNLTMVNVGWFAQGEGVVNGIVTNININDQTISIDPMQNQQFVSGRSYTFTKYPVNANPPCFKDDTKITILKNGKTTFISINEIKKGDLVKTQNEGEYIPVLMVGKCMIYNADDNI